jgi:aerobic-type carbon monoxide dehydrogenase small subunit (CoxS/CutS family)
MAYTIKVNAVDHSVDVDGDTPLLWVLRDVLGMMGTKFGCGKALCGACTVLIDDTATRSCITTIDSVGTAAITTIEAIGNTPSGKKIQKAWLDLEVVQCGIASPARSCPLLRYWQASQIPATPTSITPWQAISAAAAPTSGFARPLSRLRSRPTPMGREVEHVPRSIGFFSCR